MKTLIFKIPKSLKHYDEMRTAAEAIRISLYKSIGLVPNIKIGTTTVKKEGFPDAPIQEFGVPLKDEPWE